MGTSVASSTYTMPGHIKKSEGEDPDPDPWLVVSEDLRKKLNSKPYDPKKSCWVPDKATGGYWEGLIESTEGQKVTVKIIEKGESKVFAKDQVQQVNPPKFDCSDDMSGLTYLGDACVLWNSVVRYKNELIYTYSGLFCIAINPYKRFPIYTQRTMEIYIGKRRSECPPHIFGVAEGSYQGMMNLSKNQSILITGESGAGKTENTKKVISYFASIGATGKKKEGEIGLEDKIVNTNPVLEAWGNAKTLQDVQSKKVHLNDKTAADNHAKIPCDYCDHTFAREADLNDHIGRFHAGVKKYVCFVCHKRFKRKQSLENHVLMIHGVSGSGAPVPSGSGAGGTTGNDGGNPSNGSHISERNAEITSREQMIMMMIEKGKAELAAGRRFENGDSCDN